MPRWVAINLKRPASGRIRPEDKPKQKRKLPSSSHIILLQSLQNFIPSVADAELSFISGLDYGLNSDRHLAALREVLHFQ
jgi:hypothetical protein